MIMFMIEICICFREILGLPHYSHDLFDRFHLGTIRIKELTPLSLFIHNFRN